MLLPFFLASCEFETEDKTPPTITLIGNAEESVDMNEASKIIINSFLDVNSATVTDNLDDNVAIISTTILNSDGIQIFDISIKIPGEYKIVYYSSDISGNTATEERSLSVKDLQPPQITIEKLHDVDKYGPMPANADEYSIKIPRGTEFDDEDILYGVTLKDVWSINNGIESENPTKPTLSYEIISSPRKVTDKSVSFDVSGEYLIAYKAIDDAKNESIFNRRVFISDDIERPELTCGVLEMEPLADKNVADDVDEEPIVEGEEPIEAEPIIAQEDLRAFLKNVSTDGCQVNDGFYPYNRFSSNLELDAAAEDLTEEDRLRMSRHIIVSVLEDHPAFIKNITPTTLTRPTGNNGILVPISITDESNGYDANKVIFRKIIIRDVTPPTLARDVPSGTLSVELDASLTAAEIKEKIVELSSDKDNLDDFVEFLDKENKNIPLYVESIKDANGVEILLTDNSLNYDSMNTVVGPLTVLYTTNDGFDCPEDNLLCGNAPDAPAELRTRNMELVDTTSPQVKLPTFEGLDLQPFFSFVQATAAEYMDARKAELLAAGDLDLLDNSTQNPNDILINAKVTTTTNTACQTVGEELDFSCDGVHTVSLSATDLVLHVGDYEKEVSIYIYNQQSKDSFDEVLTTTIDGFGNEISTFNTGVNYGTGNYDLGNMVADIEAISKDSSFDPRLIPDMYFYNIPSTSSFINSQGGSYNIDIEYKSIESNYFRYYVSLAGEEKISFNRPQNKERYLDPSDGLEKVPTDGVYGSLIRFRVTVGNYSELISVFIESVAYAPIKSVKNVIIPVYPKYEVQGPQFFYFERALDDIEKETIEDNGSYNTDFISKTFYDDNIAAVRDFLDLNTSGVYPFEPGIYTPNNGVNRPGIGILVVDNLEEAERYRDPDSDIKINVPDYIVDAEGQLKPKYHKILADYIRGVPADPITGSPRIPGLIETSDGFRAILENEVSDPMKVSELNIFFIIVDKDLEFTDAAFAVKPYSHPHVYDPAVSDYLQGSKYTFSRYALADNIVDNDKCLARGVYVNAPRRFLELEPFCKVDNDFYYDKNSVLEEEFKITTETNVSGDIAGGPVGEITDTFIWEIFEKVTIDPDTGDETTEEIPGWCSTANKGCEPSEDDTRDVLSLYDLVSDLYSNKATALESEISKALEISSVVKDFEMGVIRHLVVPSVGALTTGDFLSRLSIEGLIYPLENKVNKIKNYPKEEGENAVVEVVTADGNYYTMPRETSLSFLSSGFIARSAPENLQGTRPHNLSAYDKEKIASSQPIQLSYNDMKNNKKVYEYSLKVQSKDNNSTILKIKFSEEEYFLIEKRNNSDYDTSDSIKMKHREELEDGSLAELISESAWLPDTSGILVWHVEQENNGEMVDAESGISGVFGPNFKLKPGDQSSSTTTNTNDNSGLKTGIVINIDKDLNVKVCHESVGEDDTQSYYDIACDVGK